MSLATLQFYKNRYLYPDYGSITSYGNAMNCTPVGTGLRTGTIKVSADMANFTECNYLGLTRNGKTIYAWLDDVVHSTANSFQITYRVDPWRTYRNNITLGTQFVARSSNVTYKRDDLLGSTQAYPDVITNTITFPNSTTRVFVVQVRPTGDEYSNTPTQPSPYVFYVARYTTNNWRSTEAIEDLITKLQTGAEPANLVTMYSIPYMDIESLPQASMPIERPNGDMEYSNGWRIIDRHTNNVHELLTREASISLGNVDIDELLRVDHTVQVVVPEGGVIGVPSELLKRDDLRLRQDIDLFSGASNYMLITGTQEKYGLSVRGSSISSIPILSDPMDTYLSQNQNALATSLIGDVASIGIGAAATMAGGGLGAMAGSGAITSGVNGLVSTGANLKDNAHRYNNPPAFLGTALAGAFNGRFWVVTTRQAVDNANTVHNAFGYPLEKVTSLSFPSSGGYIKTEGCSVTSDGTVPRWAIEEVNTLFNNGILVH